MKREAMTTRDIISERASNKIHRLGRQKHERDRFSKEEGH